MKVCSFVLSYNQKKNNQNLNALDVARHQSQQELEVLIIFGAFFEQVRRLTDVVIVDILGHRDRREVNYMLLTTKKSMF